MSTSEEIDAVVAGSSGAAEWTRLRLWVGRLGGQPLGTIEQGRGFTFVDADGVPRWTAQDLTDAQRAAETGVLPRTLRTWSAARPVGPVVIAIAVTAVIVLIAVGVSLVALTWW